MPPKKSCSAEAIRNKKRPAKDIPEDLKTVKKAKNEATSDNQVTGASKKNIKKPPASKKKANKDKAADPVHDEKLEPSNSGTDPRPSSKDQVDKKNGVNTQNIDSAGDIKSAKANGLAKQSPKDANLTISSWNVDGLRAWVKKGGCSYLEQHSPDIFCVQEIKCSMKKMPEELDKIEGYKKYWSCGQKEGYAGVGMLSKREPISVHYGLNGGEDVEGRVITAEFDRFYLVATYVPNAGRKLVTLPKRLEWNKLFEKHVSALEERKPVIVCGDMNVAHEEIDLTNPKTNKKNAGFTPEERAGMTDLLALGYVDTFRRLYPTRTGAYTFWSYMSNARAKNIGWRLDYFLLSEKASSWLVDCEIQSDVMGSDHCPIVLSLNVP